MDRKGFLGALLAAPAAMMSQAPTVPEHDPAGRLAQLEMTVPLRKPIEITAVIYQGEVEVDRIVRRLQEAEDLRSRVVRPWR